MNAPSRVLRTMRKSATAVTGAEALVLWYLLPRMLVKKKAKLVVGDAVKKSL
jgi:hypothetical protein